MHQFGSCYESQLVSCQRSTLRPTNMLRFSPLDNMIHGGIDARTKLIDQLDLKVHKLDFERRMAVQEWNKLSAEREMLRRL
jgi:hypothetical protein